MWFTVWDKNIVRERTLRSNIASVRNSLPYVSGRRMWIKLLQFKNRVGFIQYTTIL